MKPRLGRNDLCHCGSGKKYKRCHLDSDRMLAYPAPSESEPPRDDDPEAVQDPPSFPHQAMDPRNLAALLDQADQIASPKDRKMWKRMRADLAPVLNYMDRQSAIEAASTELNAHREAFDRLLDDSDEILRRVDALFSEEPFVPLWFTATEVRQALEKAGVKMTMVFGTELAPDRVLAALSDLADKTRRSKIAMDLLMHLPDYVAAGRFMDGWLIQHCAHLTAEFVDEPNPLLFALFHHGLQALIRELLKPQIDLIRKLGVDPDQVQKMTHDEIDALIQAQANDPKWTAEFHALLDSDPEMKARVIAEIEQSETGAMDVLSEDALVGRLLAREEIEPWFPRLTEKFNQALGNDRERLAEGTLDEASMKAAIEAIKPDLSDIARSIFTPARLRDLLQVLREMRIERMEMNDFQTARSIHGAIVRTEETVDPGENGFLMLLCLAGIRNLDPGLEEGAEPEDDSDQPESNR